MLTELTHKETVQLEIFADYVFIKTLHQLVRLPTVKTFVNLQEYSLRLKSNDCSRHSPAPKTMRSHLDASRYNVDSNDL